MVKKEHVRGLGIHQLKLYSYLQCNISTECFCNLFRSHIYWWLLLCPSLAPLHLPGLFTSQSQVLFFSTYIYHIIWIHQVPPERWWVPKLNLHPSLSPDSKLILNDLLDISSWCLINFLNSSHPKGTDLLITNLLFFISSSFLYLSEILSFLLLKLKNFQVILDSSFSFSTCKPSTDFPGGPVVRTLWFHCRGSGSFVGGTNIL